MQFTRHAIYVTPAPRRFADLGAAWLGWDSATGRPAGPPALPDLPAPCRRDHRDAARYGLHATIRRPFAWPRGQTVDTLLDAFTQFCRGTRPVTLDGLDIAAMGRFLALVPSGDTAALDALAADTLRAVDRFRAPLGEPSLPAAANRPSPRAGRQPDPLGLSSRDVGLPLSHHPDRQTPASELPMIRDVLDRHLMPVVPRPFPIDALSLMGEDSQGRFHLIRRQPLGRLIRAEKIDPPRNTREKAIIRHSLVTSRLSIAH